MGLGSGHGVFVYTALILGGLPRVPPFEGGFWPTADGHITHPSFFAALGAGTWPWVGVRLTCRKVSCGKGKVFCGESRIPLSVDHCVTMKKFFSGSAGFSLKFSAP